MPDGRPVTWFVDIGNTSIGVARFAMPAVANPADAAEDWWRTPLEHAQWRPDHPPPWDQLSLRGGPATWVVASVNREISQRLQQQVGERFPDVEWQTLQSQDFPVTTRVADKRAVGADRLAAVVAANALREPNRGAVIVDAGSAINVELVDEAGIFQGGAILPGMAMAARALASNTDLLPTVEPADSAPFPIGRDTNEAIRSGLYWGAWGAIRELAARMAQQCTRPPHMMLTGGGILWRDLQRDMEVYPHLVLSGIALAWSQQ